MIFLKEKVIDEVAIKRGNGTKVFKVNDHRFRGHLRICEVDSPSNARMLDAIAVMVSRGGS